ncbi:uncharacterized protein SEPMUDRAFT_109728 [Sphaerulina musiva SO2202]|uniref:Uncharacterized protein n=1 Tax=Sphaerulina musiva (strain SO2202) TaxID=692275 RepID=N1QDX9_SPHMS|nr:uncharacterized protein SEPMUDRAFT_109728 [Sphaerulina musiva SO2202]EMF10415.1 hypothetical protein SEPMUDRAFT_109728 [Sphaerulina musiva SO2202]
MAIALISSIAVAAPIDNSLMNELAEASTLTERINEIDPRQLDSVTGLLAPVTGEAAPVLSEAAPVLNEAAPVLSETAPVLSEAAPVEGLVQGLKARQLNSLLTPVQGLTGNLGGALQPVQGLAGGLTSGGLKGLVPIPGNPPQTSSTLI